ncbi:MAG: site-specific integrase [Sellimonas intestinalis]
MRKNKQKPKKMFFIYTKDFFNHLRSELHSERTIETYCQSLNAFRIYLYETYSKTVDQITTDFITEEVIREFY